MTIFLGSRYEHALVDQVMLPDGSFGPIVVPPEPDTTGIRYMYRVTTEGERYEQIARRLWNDSSRWYIIADLNPEYPFPDQLAPNTVIRVPV